MSEFIQVSYQAMKVIPDESKRILHHTWEDTDLEGAEEADELCDFLEREAPGVFVRIQANDTVYPKCDTWKTEHYHCELYDGNWYTILVPRKIWDEYKSQVEIADQAWKDANQCKVAPAVKRDWVWPCNICDNLQDSNVNWQGTNARCHRCNRYICNDHGGVDAEGDIWCETCAKKHEAVLVP